MLGLSAQNDRPNRSLALAPTGKSFRFAEHNIGRFHTSGVSGGMKKHSVKAKREKAAPPENAPKPIQSFAPKRLEVRKKEIEEDTKRLMELEAKLAEVKRQKEVRVARAEARQRNRLEYLAACLIQHVVSRFLTRRAENAVKIIKAFLRFTSNQHALAAAAWAAGVIRRFSIRFGRRFRAWLHRRNYERTLLAEVEETSRRKTVASRNMARELTDGAISMGFRTAVLCLSTKKTKTKPTNRRGGFQRTTSHSKFGVVKNSDKDLLTSLSPYRRARCFLMDKGLHFDSPMYRHKRVFTDGWRNPASKLDYTNMANGTSKQPSTYGAGGRRISPLRSPLQSPPRSTSPGVQRSMTRTQSSPQMTTSTFAQGSGGDALVALRLAQAKLAEEHSQHNHIPGTGSTGASGHTQLATQHHPAAPVFIHASAHLPPSAHGEAANGNVAMEDEYHDRQRREDEDEEAYEREKALRLALLHKQRQDAMEVERAARLRLIEEQKKEREASLREALRKEGEEHRRREQQKTEFLRRIVSEQVQRARVIKALRDVKEKKQREQEEAQRMDRESAKNEMKLMFAEDVRYHCVLEKQRRRICTYKAPVGVKAKDSMRSRPRSAAAHYQDDCVEPDGNESSANPEGGNASASAVDKMSNKPKIPKPPPAAQPKKPVELTQEEKEMMILEQAFRDKEKAKQLAASKAAMKQRILAQKSKEKDEKEKVAAMEEIKKKEQEMLSMKAQFLVQRGLQKKQEMLQAAKLKKKKCGSKACKHTSQKTNSAGGSGANAAKFIDKTASSNGGSAPASSEKHKVMSALDWVPDDPLSDVGTAQLWDWHKDTPKKKTPRGGSGHGAGEEGDGPDVDCHYDCHNGVECRGNSSDSDVDDEQKGDGNNDIRASAGNPCDDDEEDEEEKQMTTRDRSAALTSRTNSTKSNMGRFKDLASSTPALPTIDPKQKHVLAPQKHKGKGSRKLPAKLANSPFAPASSKSRPVLPVVKGSMQDPARDDSKMGKVAALMQIVDKARQSLTDSTSMPSRPAIPHLPNGIAATDNKHTAKVRIVKPKKKKVTQATDTVEVANPIATMERVKSIPNLHANVAAVGGGGGGAAARLKKKSSAVTSNKSSTNVSIKRKGEAVHATKKTSEEDEEGSKVIEAFFSFRRNKCQASASGINEDRLYNEPSVLIRGSSLEEKSLICGSSLEDKSSVLIDGAGAPVLPVVDPHRSESQSTVLSNKKGGSNLVSPIQLNASPDRILDTSPPYNSIAAASGSSQHRNSAAAQRYATLTTVGDGENNFTDCSAADSECSRDGGTDSACDGGGDSNREDDGEEGYCDYEDDFDAHPSPSKYDAYPHRAGGGDDSKDGDGDEFDSGVGYDLRGCTLPSHEEPGDDTAETEEERRLNMECETLRCRLEEKIFAAQMYMENLAATGEGEDEDEEYDDEYDGDEYGEG